MLIALARLADGGATADQRRTWSGRSGGYLIAWLLAGPTWLTTLLMLVDGRAQPLQLALLLASTLALFPWPLTRTVLIPLGLVRSAWWLTRLSDWTWGRDLRGGAAVAAVLAAWRGQPPPTSAIGARWRRIVTRPDDLRWARERVQRLELFGAGGAVAALLLADLDGDTDRADGLADVVAAFDPVVVPAAAARLVAERTLWRIADDDTRTVESRRDAIGTLASHGSPTVRLCQALLRRDAAPGVGVRLACAWWWLLAPRRRQTWPLLVGIRRLLPASPTAPVRPATPPPAADAGDALARAAARHAELTGRRDIGVDDVVTLAGLWQAGLPRVLGWLRSRAVTLNVDAEEAAREFEAGIEAALRPHVERLDLGGIDLRTLPPVLQCVVDDIRSARMDALEIAVAAWRHRLEAGIDRAPVDEFREWASLRTLAHAVARTGSDGRCLAWETSKGVVAELAVRLWNVRRERRLANAIFRALLVEARAVGDLRTAETMAENVACGP
jgi:hypothetical protein